jgi:hypothetical protein
LYCQPPKVSAVAADGLVTIATTMTMTTCS